jgi:hypothetical protein
MSDCMNMVTARTRLPALILSVALLVALGGTTRPAAKERPPNILFIVMDDVGIDQMKLFGYGGVAAPQLPTIEQVAASGVRFGNTWSMPACTTSRAVFFSGRYPLRTNAFGALGPNDLANSHLSPYEITTPTLLKERGYRSAMFGKFHLALQGKSPYREAMVRSLGWDYFYGWLDETGDPSSIDTTAGGVADRDTWSCGGFVPGTDIPGGADSGACYRANNTCQEMSSSGPLAPGRACRDAGGIFVPNEVCQTSPPEKVNFETLSGHYVSPLTINREDGTVEEVPSTDLRARTFRGTSVVDAAVDWIRRQSGDSPWMASVNFASAHTPLMQPPAHLLGPEGAVTIDCTKPFAERALTNQMIEAMDTEIARLLVQTGVAQRDADGTLRYDPAASNTMIVIVGDNGSFGSTVKPPFDPTRAKGSAYQTGVWVPLVIAGPLVNSPNRDVEHMVNIADLYHLFGELAGINVEKSVPRPIDGVRMMPYLLNPQQPGIRKSNFTQVGPNIQPDGAINGPCVIGDTCTQIPVTQEVCEDNGGTWWGAGAEEEIPGLPPGGLTKCCEVNQFLGEAKYSIQPLTSTAVRNEQYKIVKNFLYDYNESDNECFEKETDEFYLIDQAPETPKLDNAPNELKRPFTREQQKNYDALFRQLNAILNSQPECAGDGNIDGVVDDQDVEDWQAFVELSGGKSSWYDLNRDGLTDAEDLQIIRENMGAQCKVKK